MYQNEAKFISASRTVLNCDDQRWYSKRLVWPIHASWHFCDHHFGQSLFHDFFFAVISSAKCHWHSHVKFPLKQNHVSVTSSTVMIRGETQTVDATITCLETFCATKSLVSHLVATFSVSDYHDSHGRYAVRVSDHKQMKELAFSLKCSLKPNNQSR